MEHKQTENVTNTLCIKTVINLRLKKLVVINTIKEINCLAVLILIEVRRLALSFLSVKVKVRTLFYVLK